MKPNTKRRHWNMPICRARSGSSKVVSWPYRALCRASASRLVNRATRYVAIAPRKTLPEKPVFFRAQSAARAGCNFHAYNLLRASQRESTPESRRAESEQGPRGRPSQTWPPSSRARGGRPERGRRSAPPAASAAPRRPRTRTRARTRTT